MPWRGKITPLVAAIAFVIPPCYLAHLKTPHVDDGLETLRTPFSQVAGAIANRNEQRVLQIFDTAVGLAAPPESLCSHLDPSVVAHRPRGPACTTDFSRGPPTPHVFSPS